LSSAQRPVNLFFRKKVPTKMSGGGVAAGYRTCALAGALVPASPARRTAAKLSTGSTTRHEPGRSENLDISQSLLCCHAVGYRTALPVPPGTGAVAAKHRSHHCQPSVKGLPPPAAPGERDRAA